MLQQFIELCTSPTGLYWLVLASDVSIAVAYFAIPITMAVVLRDRPDDIPYPWLWILFVTFIVACGLTHVAHVLSAAAGPQHIWLLAVVSAFCALASVGTAGAFAMILPQIKLLPSPARQRAELVRDITERKHADQHQKLLVAELDHRVKNILAQVVVVAQSTRQGSQSIDEFLRSLDGRIGCMASAHSLLSENNWRGVGLAALVRNQLAPYATGANVTVSGTDIILSASEIQAVAMVLHELVTNAAKHGALSISDGRVEVTWDRKPYAEDTLKISWREAGGPPVVAKAPSGYGTALIRELVPHELGGAVDLEFREDGVCCSIELLLNGRAIPAQ